MSRSTARGRRWLFSTLDIAKRHEEINGATRAGGPTFISALFRSHVINLSSRVAQSEWSVRCLESRLPAERQPPQERNSNLVKNAKPTQSDLYRLR